MHAPLTIRNVRLAYETKSPLFDVICEDGKLQRSQRSSSESRSIPTENVVDGEGGLLLPSLCHSHIHLDKCYILGKGKPLITGDFSEALAVTANVKQQFKDNFDDLFARGDRLIRESVEAGVTVMRTHIESDATVGDICLKAGAALKEKWSGVCDIQLCLFLQEAAYDDSGPSLDMLAAEEAIPMYLAQLSAIGSAPYVDLVYQRQIDNLQYFLKLAIKHHLHADFHLDYNLATVSSRLTDAAEMAPLILHLINIAHDLDWARNNPGKVITIGHATRLSIFTDEQLSELRTVLGDLPIYFVGLPQSDLYMMGRDDNLRGTINVVKLGRDHHFNVAISVNNVGNAFTPQGSVDPLGLCVFGTAVYQDGTIDGCRRLLNGVTTSSKRAIGLPPEAAGSLIPKPGEEADFVILTRNETLQSAALEPAYDRITIKSGRVMARRKASSQIY